MLLTNNPTWNLPEFMYFRVAIYGGLIFRIVIKDLDVIGFTGQADSEIGFLSQIMA